jgi:hypothetical protein
MSRAATAAKDIAPPVSANEEVKQKRADQGLYSFHSSGGRLAGKAGQAGDAARFLLQRLVERAADHFDGPSTDHRSIHDGGPMDFALGGKDEMEPKNGWV